MQQSGQPLFPARGLWLIAPPVFAYVAMQAVLWLYGAKPVVDIAALAPSSTAPQWAEAAARMTLLGYILLFVAATLGVLLKTARDILVLFDARSKMNVLVVIFIVAVLSSLTLFPGAAGLIPRYRNLFGASLFSVAAKSFDTGSWGPGTLDAAAAIMTLSISVAAGCFALLVISCIGSFRSIGPSEGWKFQFDRLKFYTYLASTFMIIGLMMNRAWLSYPSFLIAEPEAAQAFRSLVNAFTIYLGIGYTLIIGSVAVPVSYHLYIRANAIAAEVQQTQLPRESAPFASVLLEVQRQKAGVAVTPLDVFKSIIAVLGPFVAGSVASLPAFG